MDICPGTKADKDVCLTLKKFIYVLLQSARQFYVKLVKALKSCCLKEAKLILACGSRIHPVT